MTGERGKVVRVALRVLAWVTKIAPGSTHQGLAVDVWNTRRCLVKIRQLTRPKVETNFSFTAH